MVLLLVVDQQIEIGISRLIELDDRAGAKSEDGFEIGGALADLHDHGHGQL